MVCASYLPESMACCETRTPPQWGSIDVDYRLKAIMYTGFLKLGLEPKCHLRRPW